MSQVAHKTELPRGSQVPNDMLAKSSIESFRFSRRINFNPSDCSKIVGTFQSPSYEETTVNIPGTPLQFVEYVGPLRKDAPVKDRKESVWRPEETWEIMLRSVDEFCEKRSENLRNFQVSIFNVDFRVRLSIKL